MTIPEEAGKVATSAIEGFRGSPTCLAAIMLAAIFAVLTYLSLTAERRESHERAMVMTERCFPMGLMNAIRDDAVQDFRESERRDYDEHKEAPR